MVAAGLLARNAVARGLTTKPWVKTSLAPGSRAVTDYLHAAGLMEPLEALRFHLVGYGCTTCIGNSGPLAEPIAEAIEANDLVGGGGAVGQPQLRGPHPSAGPRQLPRLAAARRRVRARRPHRHRPDDRAAGHRCATATPVMLADIWPSAPRRSPASSLKAVSGDVFKRNYASVFDGDDRWRDLPVPAGDRYAWDEASTYVARPPFFDGLATGPARSG